MNSIPVELRQAMYCKAIDLYKEEQAVIIQKYARRWLIKNSDTTFDGLWINKYEMALENYRHDSFEIEFPEYTVFNADCGDRIINIESQQQNILLKFDSTGNGGMLDCVDLINSKVIDGYMLFLGKIDDDTNYEDTVTVLIFDEYDKLEHFKSELEFPKLRASGHLLDITLKEEKEFYDHFDNY